MKKFIITLSIIALTVSVYAMSKAPTDDSACATNKACVKEAAACCTTDGSCKLEKAAACAAETATNTTNAIKEKTGCTGGVCPLKK